MPVRARMEVPPLTGLATPPGKMYLLLFVQRSVYGHRRGEKREMGDGGEVAETRGRERESLEVEVDKKLPGDDR